GGTLDKLESIPGFRTNLSITEYIEKIKRVGAVLIGQTDEIAPADKKIYALRDVTATVESIPLICASIMSKKLAEGIDALVLDVKTGNGAFMKTFEQAENLALNLKSISDAFGKKTIAFITNMSQPLGFNVGNWLEIVESVECLKGKSIEDLMEVSLNLSGAMIYLGGISRSIDEGIEISNDMISSGKAYKKFLEICQAQGGDISYIENMDKYPKSKNVIHIKANQNGYINSIDAFEIGMAGIELGAGRIKKDDVIDPKAGFIFHKKIGDYTEAGENLVTIFTDKFEIEQTIERISKSFSFTQDKPEKMKMILKVIAD
ncbi:MAG: thymidine phosphorylase, partial [Ignavibacteria bacterium]|nr:thymidine phosphorylase [Ignavibacteria bacterium]